jgi:hypothetical protein
MKNVVQTVKWWFRKKLKRKEPLVRLLSTGTNSAGDITIELDWNDAFVAMLRGNGYVGASDDDVVKRWVSEMSAKIAGDISSDTYKG